jgi:N-methylhydantoinase B/oxoprolinase/acetone carboxylase alpha subunit
MVGGGRAGNIGRSHRHAALPDGNWELVARPCCQSGTSESFGSRLADRGNHPDYDESFVRYDIMSGGWGGRYGHDGNDCVIAINGNCRFNPT